MKPLEQQIYSLDEHRMQVINDEGHVIWTTDPLDMSDFATSFQKHWDEASAWAKQYGLDPNNHVRYHRPPPEGRYLR